MMRLESSTFPHNTRVTACNLHFISHRPRFLISSIVSVLITASPAPTLTQDQGDKTLIVPTETIVTKPTMIDSGQDHSVKKAASGHRGRHLELSRSTVPTQRSDPVEGP